MSRQPTPEELQQIHESLFNGNRIAAVKIYREITECNLTESKQYVEGLETQLKTQFPNKFTRQPIVIGNRGCLIILLIDALIVAAVAVYFLHKNGIL